MLGKKALILSALIFAPSVVVAQDTLPADNGLATYHTAPRYRESESHPLRVVAYVVHPIGWVFREVFFRPLSYFASSTETTRSVMGFREPYDYRQPECFSADDSAPDCRSLVPFNYDTGPGLDTGSGTESALVTQRQVYFPDVNFDFDRSSLNDLGRGRVHQIARLVRDTPGLRIVLQGHTDYIGTDQYNERLGMNRAETVRSELETLGVPSETLSTVTFGQTQPVLDEQEDWARAVNRRVEIHLDNGSAQQFVE